MEWYEKKIKSLGYSNFEEAVRDFQRKNYGARYVGATLRELEIPDYEAATLVKFMREPKNFLIYNGSAGCGKTRFCASITDWIFKNFNTFRYHAEFDLLAKLRSGISEGLGDYAKHLEYLIDDDFVILDDVGSGINPTKVTYKDLEWRREIFFDFLDIRYNSMKPTIITSNFDRSDFKTIYSERIYSRLFATENLVIGLFGEQYDKRAQGK